MGNTQDKLLNDPEIQKLRPKFSPLEMYMLGLLFKDLAARNDEFIDKETFLQFFPLTGLWGEKLFEKFDFKHTGYINFYGFLQGIASCCKSTEDEKVHLLFSLYDMDQDGYIKKKEMITMLYNYPKNHIKFITEEIAPDHGEKLEQVSEARRLSLNNLDEIDNVLASPHVQRDREERDKPGSIHSEHLDGALNDELVVAEEDKKAQKFLPVQREISKSYSFYSQRESQIQMQIQVINDANKKSANEKSKKLPQLDMRGLEEPKKTADVIGSPDQIATRKNSLDKNIPRKAANKDTTFPAPDPLKLAAGRKSSTSTVILDQSFVAATTVNTRVKEYASFIFRSFEGANSRGKISYDEFKQWIVMHPMILKVFDETFHQDIWATPEVPPLGASFTKKSALDLKGNLQFRDKPAEMSGYIYKTKKVMKGWKKRYFELREHFLFFWSKKEDKQPKGVIFLDGCEVEELKELHTAKKFGFKISHKSDTYENHLFYCTEKREFDEWMFHLKDFNSANILQKYTFHEKIGTGKFSVVYRASCKTNKNEEYAIKVIEKKLLKPEEKEFLLSETSVMKILDHPNVIKLIDTIETKTHIYIITEIVKDGDLFDYIINREFLEECDASFIMKQLITSIYFLHNIGIIHRDLKPENLLISLGDFEQVKEVKIIDFGFAKLINAGEKLRDTCGTPNYVAPEVLRGTGYDKTADVWSLGVIMYLMVRGYLPFDAHDVNVILKNTLKAEIPLDDEHWEKCSPEARDLVSKFLHKDPSKRISLVDAAQHPWIKNREGLKQYHGVNRNGGGTNESNSGVAYYGSV